MKSVGELLIELRIVVCRCISFALLFFSAGIFVLPSFPYPSALNFESFANASAFSHKQTILDGVPVSRETSTTVTRLPGGRVVIKKITRTVYIRRYQVIEPGVEKFIRILFGHPFMKEENGYPLQAPRPVARLFPKSESDPSLLSQLPATQSCQRLAAAQVKIEVPGYDSYTGQMTGSGSVGTGTLVVDQSGQLGIATVGHVVQQGNSKQVTESFDVSVNRHPYARGGFVDGQAMNFNNIRANGAFDAATGINSGEAVFIPIEDESLYPGARERAIQMSEYLRPSQLADGSVVHIGFSGGGPLQAYISRDARADQRMNVMVSSSGKYFGDRVGQNFADHSGSSGGVTAYIDRNGNCFPFGQTSAQSADGRHRMSSALSPLMDAFRFVASLYQQIKGLFQAKA